MEQDALAYLQTAGAPATPGNMNRIMMAFMDNQALRPSYNAGSYTADGTFIGADGQGAAVGSYEAGRAAIMRGDAPDAVRERFIRAYGDPGRLTFDMGMPEATTGARAEPIERVELENMGAGGARSGQPASASASAPATSSRTETVTPTRKPMPVDALTPVMTSADAAVDDSNNGMMLPPVVPLAPRQTPNGVDPVRSPQRLLEAPKSQGDTTRPRDVKSGQFEIQKRIDAGDVDGAKTIFDDIRSGLDPQQQNEISQSLDNARNSGRANPMADVNKMNEARTRSTPIPGVGDATTDAKGDPVKPAAASPSPSATPPTPPTAQRQLPAPPTQLALPAPQKQLPAPDSSMADANVMQATKTLEEAIVRGDVRTANETLSVLRQSLPPEVLEQYRAAVEALDPVGKVIRGLSGVTSRGR